MYLFVYKTTHTTGKYYIGRHETDNLGDGYLGSGDWVKSIKDKSTLTREIIVEATSIEELKTLEEYHISLHFGKPECMNYKRGSDGWTSQDVSEINRKRVIEGTHPFAGELGSSLSKQVQKNRVDAGTHHLLGGKIQKESNKRRLVNGTHHWLSGELQRESAKRRVTNGTHHFLGGELNRKRAENGTHHFQGGDIQRETARKLLEAGLHHSQLSWTCPHCNKSGKGKSNFTRYHGDNCKSSPTQKT